MSTYHFSNFPKATVIFGNKTGRTEYEKLKENLSMLNKLAAGLSQGLVAASKFSTKLASSVAAAGNVATVISVLVLLIGEVEKLYEELKNLEQKVFNIILEGKMRALHRHLGNLQDANTSEAQRVSEISDSITQLDELLPIFSNEESIFRERYYIGAPLFIHFCGILKAICFIAEQLPAYNSNSLPNLKKDYQGVLDWFRIRCIGRRMASCYVKGMLGVPGCAWTHDWTQHYKRYNELYYPGPPEATPYLEYALDLGGTGWRVWCGSMTYVSIIDLWDYRPHGKVEFEPLEIHNTSALPDGFGVGAAAGVVEVKYHRDVLKEYRSRVERVMLEFFNEANIIIE